MLKAIPSCAYKKGFFNYKIIQRKDFEMYDKVSTNLNFVEREKATEQFWKDNAIFEKSIKMRENCPSYTFYDVYEVALSSGSSGGGCCGCLICLGILYMASEEC